MRCLSSGLVQLGQILDMLLCTTAGDKLIGDVQMVYIMTRAITTGARKAASSVLILFPLNSGRTKECVKDGGGGGR